MHDSCYKETHAHHPTAHDEEAEEQMGFACEREARKDEIVFWVEKQWGRLSSERRVPIWRDGKRLYGPWIRDDDENTEERYTITLKRTVRSRRE